MRPGSCGMGPNSCCLAFLVCPQVCDFGWCLDPSYPHILASCSDGWSGGTGEASEGQSHGGGGGLPQSRGGWQVAKMGEQEEGQEQEEEDVGVDTAHVLQVTTGCVFGGGGMVAHTDDEPRLID